MVRPAIHPVLVFLPIIIFLITYSVTAISLFIYFKRRYPDDIILAVTLAFSVGPLNQFYIKKSSATYFILTLIAITITAFINKGLAYITATLLPALLIFIRMKYISPYWKGKHDSFLDIGTVLLSNGDYYQALHYLKGAAKDNPFGHDALCALGLCYAKLKKTGKSILYINKAAELGSEAAKEYLKNNYIAAH